MFCLCFSGVVCWVWDSLLFFLYDYLNYMYAVRYTLVLSCTHMYNIPSLDFEGPLLLVEEGVPPHEILCADPLLLLVLLPLSPGGLLCPLSLDLLQLLQQLSCVIFITKNNSIIIHICRWDSYCEVS